MLSPSSNSTFGQQDDISVISAASSSSNSLHTQQSNNQSLLPRSESSKSQKTSTQAHESRVNDCNSKLLRDDAYKVATILVHLYKDKKLPGVKSIQYLVDVTNQMVSNDGEPLREIAKSVNANKIGVPARKQGRKGKLDGVIFDALCNLIFSFAPFPRLMQRESSPILKLFSCWGQ